MRLYDGIKHVSIGGIGVALTSYLASKYAKTRDDWSEEKKASFLGAVIGTSGGSAAGYIVADVVIDGKVPGSKKNKLIGTGGGALLGAILGYVIGKKAGQAKVYYSSQQKAGEQPTKQQGGGA